MSHSQLLISVRNIAEATDALAAGADLIDVKEPQRGALGMADDEAVRAVLELVAGRVPTSVALGELVATERIPRFERPPTYVKFGLAGAVRHTDWPAQLAKAIAELPPNVRPVAVAYADWNIAAAPAPEEVLSVAGKLRCRGVLLDTFDKSAGPLPTHLAFDHTRALLDEARRQGLLTVLAGGLSADDLPKLAPLAPDYFGFRGAACRGDRTRTIDAERIHLLREQLESLRDAAPLAHQRTTSSV